MALLAITRPYEGIFLCLPIAIALLVWAVPQNAPPLKTLLKRIAVPASSIARSRTGLARLLFPASDRKSIHHPGAK